MKIFKKIGVSVIRIFDMRYLICFSNDVQINVQEHIIKEIILHVKSNNITDADTLRNYLNIRLNYGHTFASNIFNKSTEEELQRNII